MRHWRRTLVSLTRVSSPRGFAGEDEGSGTLHRTAGPGSGGLSQPGGPLHRTEHERTAAAKITQTWCFCGKGPTSQRAVEHPTYLGTLTLCWAPESPLAKPPRASRLCRTRPAPSLLQQPSPSQVTVEDPGGPFCHPSVPKALQGGGWHGHRAPAPIPPSRWGTH